MTDLDPLSLPVSGAVAWYDASQITGVSDGAALAFWPDATGSGHDLSQSFSADQPTYYSSTSAKLINGNPAVWFDGAHHFMPSAAAFALSQPYTIVAVAQNTRTTANGILWSSHITNEYLDTSSTSGGWDLYFNGTTYLTVGTFDQHVHFTAGVGNSGASRLYVDGLHADATNIGSGALSNTFYIGCGYTTSPVAYWQGPVCEVIVYPSALSSTDVATLYTYLQGKWGAGVPPAISGTASLALGPLTITSSSAISAPTITGTAVLNIGPLVITTADVIETRLGTSQIFLGPLEIVSIGGRLGPGAWPVPGYRGRWRLTLHTRQFGPATLASTMIAELGDARSRKLTQAWNTPATLTFTVDGQSQSALVIEELLHDVVAWRWDDQTGQEFAVFRGVIAQAQDTLDQQSHVVAFTCHDYGSLLSRRLITSTYTETSRDQDLVVGDLLSLASSAGSSSGTSFTPAAYLPLSLRSVDPSGVARGLSGQLRDITYYGSQNIGTAFTDLAAAASGFDFDVLPSATDATDELRIFYPQQGVSRSDVTLQYGSTVAALTRTVDSSAYANYVRVLGNNSTSAPTPQLFAEAWTGDCTSIANPVGVWMLADNLAQSTVTSMLSDKANGDLQLDAVLVPSYALTLTPNAYTWGNPNMGDVVPLVVQSGRLDVNTTVRVLGIEYDIGDDGQEDVVLTVARPQSTLAQLFTAADENVKALALR